VSVRIDPSALGAHLKSRKSLKKKKNDGVDGLEGGRERACCLVRGRHRSGDQQPTMGRVVRAAATAAPARFRPSISCSPECASRPFAGCGVMALLIETSLPALRCPITVDRGTRTEALNVVGRFRARLAIARSPGHRWIGDGLIAQHDRIAGLN